MARLSDDVRISAQTDVLPPPALTVDGVPRRRNREITPEDAVRLAGRGLRSSLLSFGFGAEVTVGELTRAITGYRSHFDGMGAGHPAEAWTHVYGRRDPKTREDTRIVVTTSTGMSSSASASTNRCLGRCPRRTGPDR